jgi:hypothetical protein
MGDTTTPTTLHAVSMLKEERQAELAEVLAVVAEVVHAVTGEGVRVAFFNSDAVATVTSRAEATALLAHTSFTYASAIGTELHYRVLEPLLLTPLAAWRLRKVRSWARWGEPCTAPPPSPR